MITCPVCGKELTQDTNDEACLNSPYVHGKHPIFVCVLLDLKISLDSVLPRTSNTRINIGDCDSLGS